MQIFALTAHLATTLVRLGPPGGVRAVTAESLLLKHQLLRFHRALILWNYRLLFTPRDRQRPGPRGMLLCVENYAIIFIIKRIYRWQQPSLDGQNISVHFFVKAQ